MANDMEREGRGRTVLITGASAGIGAALAACFAKRGFTLILTARRRERLADLAETLQDRHGVAAHVVVADLADPRAPDMLMDRVDALGLPVDVLVNNAGHGMPHTFVETDWQTQADFLQVMTTAVVHLTHLVLPGMLERGWGRVMQVSSAAGYMPGSAGATLYIPMKSLLIKFAQSLTLELEGTGVAVMALCPGFTYSEFHDVTGSRAQVSKLPNIMWMQAEDVAEQGYKALMKGRKPVYVNGMVNRFLTGLATYLPDSAVLALSRQRDP